MNRTLRTLAALTAMAMAGLLGVATRTHAQTLVTGSIAGTVTDANGSKLSGVQITVDTGQMDVTNASGYFIITDVLPGTHSVEASLVGYQPVRATNVVVTQELTTTVDLQLAKRTVQRTQTQVVQVPLIRKSVTPTLYTVTSKEEQLVRSQPNNLYQYPGALISQPGVVPDSQGYPTIRGAKSDQINYMVDGITIIEPLTNSFGTNLVTVGMDRMNVYTGGYRAELGSAIGGVVNAVIKTGASIRGAAVEATTGSWDYTGMVYEQGNVEKSGLNWYVSGNFFRTGFEKNLQIQSLDASADVAAKFVQPIGKGRLTLLGTAGFERYQMNVNDPRDGLPWGGAYPAAHDVTVDPKADPMKGPFKATPLTGDYAPQGNSIVSLTYALPFNANSNIAAQYYHFDSHVEFNELSPWTSLYSRRRSTINAGRVDYTNQLSQGLQLRFGGELADNNPYNLLVAPGSVRNPYTYKTEHTIQYRTRDIDTQDLNAYISATAKPNDALTLDVGARYDSRQYTRNQTVAGVTTDVWAPVAAQDLAALKASGSKPKLDKVTPRAGFTYSLSKNLLLKGSAGQFIQMPPAIYVERTYHDAIDNYGFTNPAIYNPSALRQFNRKVFDVKPQVANNYDLGFEAQLNDRIGLAMTPFYRKVKDETVYVAHNFDYIDNNGNPRTRAIGQFESTGFGHVRGLETKLQMRERRGLSGWITYTLQSSKDNNTASFTGNTLDAATLNAEHRVDYDQKHTVYVVGTYRMGSFEINPMLELGSGYPYGGQAGDAGDPNNPNDPKGDGRYAYLPDGETIVPILVGGRVQSLEVNPYNTGWHKNLSVTFRLYTDKSRASYYFLQVQNITRSNDVTSRSIFDPQTGALVGYDPTPVDYVDQNGNTRHSDAGSVQYQPYSRVPPIFVLVGVRKTF